MAQSGTGDVAEVVSRMRQRLACMTADQQGPRAFLATYLRTTVAVGEAIERGFFEDGPWVEAWDVAFADLYFEAFDADAAGCGRAPQPWQLAFGAPSALPASRHVLLGVNAHINYDLPRALLAVIDDDAFADPDVMGLRRRDHERIDAVLSTQVVVENRRLAAPSSIPLLSRVLQPLSRRASRRFLRQARRKVWHNAMALQRARLAGPDAYDARLGELERLCAAGAAELMGPGPVLVRLGIGGSGVVLPH